MFRRFSGPIALLFAALLAAFIVPISPASGHASAVLAGSDESNGCIGVYGEIAAWDLKRNGKKRPDMGGIRLAVNRDTNPDTFCATTWSNSKTWHRKKYLSVKFGFYPKGGGQIAWSMIRGSTWDYGRYKQFAGGVWTKIPEDKCLAIEGKMRWKAKWYTRKVRTSRCN